MNVIHIRRLNNGMLADILFYGMLLETSDFDEGGFVNTLMNLPTP